jgi:hypothetical protein
MIWNQEAGRRRHPRLVLQSLWSLLFFPDVTKPHDPSSRCSSQLGSKDRYVLFGRSFATALRTHIAAHPHNRWLFQTQRHGKFGTRRVQQIVSKYAGEAGVKATRDLRSMSARSQQNEFIPL